MPAQPAHHAATNRTRLPPQGFALPATHPEPCPPAHLAAGAARRQAVQQAVLVQGVEVAAGPVTAGHLADLLRTVARLHARLQACTYVWGRGWAGVGQKRQFAVLHWAHSERWPAPASWQKTQSWTTPARPTRPFPAAIEPLCRWSHNRTAKAHGRLLQKGRHLTFPGGKRYIAGHHRWTSGSAGPADSLPGRARTRSFPDPMARGTSLTRSCWRSVASASGLPTTTWSLTYLSPRGKAGRSLLLRQSMSREERSGGRGHGWRGKGGARRC